MDWDRLGKLMRLTESEHDGEALNALRMANRLLAADSLNWSDVAAMIEQPRRVPRSAVPKEGKRGTARYGQRADQRRPADTRRHDGADINAMFGTLAVRRMDVMTMTLVAAMRGDWDKNGYLTGAQYDTLKTIYGTNSTSGRGSWQF